MDIGLSPGLVHKPGPNSSDRDFGQKCSPFIMDLYAFIAIEKKIARSLLDFNDTKQPEFLHVLSESPDFGLDFVSTRDQFMNKSL